MDINVLNKKYEEQMSHLNKVKEEILKAELFIKRLNEEVMFTNGKIEMILELKTLINNVEEEKDLMVLEVKEEDLKKEKI